MPDRERSRPTRRLTLCILALVVLVGLAIAAAYLSHHFFFTWLAPLARTYKGHPLALTLVFLAIFISAFPPLVGYSTAATVAGFVAGFPGGWPLAATAAVAGSLAAFAASRSVLGRCVESPKLLVHVFIGSRLALLADEGDTMSTSDKAINYLSMAASALIGLIVGLMVYRRTMARAAQLAREDIHHHHPRRHLASSAADAEAGYHDVDAPLLDPDDAAAVMLDDNLSSWTVDGGEEEEDHGRSKAAMSGGGNGHSHLGFSA
ncbi:hypothetical protein CDD80_5338 [Ophiocordyceps camponoti-rufipedis]|uniref:Golgi apparatus membrane protein TVP38 n=1 Tax=Ophiocordyceps camponoti-rufipedis TaxID=2004952 RepID=A0A2C5YUR3_9HYPO|nr:hypothetical protein CDD80_5338 [Ophiocordyceps camponoti-rufipedis]